MYTCRFYYMVGMCGVCSHLTAHLFVSASLRVFGGPAEAIRGTMLQTCRASVCCPCLATQGLLWVLLVHK